MRNLGIELMVGTWYMVGGEGEKEGQLLTPDHRPSE